MAQIISTGATLEWQVSASYTAVGQLISWGDHEMATEPVDITLLSDRRKQWAPGTVTDLGEMDFVVAFDPKSTQHLAMLSLVDAAAYPTAQSFRITYPTTPATAWAFSGIVYKVSIGGAESNGKLLGTFTIRFTSWPA